MRHGETGLFDPERLLNGIPGTILDQQYGLLWWAPLLMLAPFGALLLWKRAPDSRYWTWHFSPRPSVPALRASGTGGGPRRRGSWCP